MKYLKKKIEVSLEETQEKEKTVREIIANVRTNKDAAVIEYNKKFDNCERKNLLVIQEEIEEAYKKVDAQLIEDIKKSAENVKKFAVEQKNSMREISDFEIVPGVFLGHRIIPIQNIGCYIPGGSYPLYSTAIMLVVPARVAGVKRIAACAPPMKGTDKIHPSTLVALDIAGADEIYTVGGVQSIAALAYGTEQIKAVDKIVGPGNQFVTEAKRQCFGQIGIDFIAGPSEVLIIADETGNVEYIAADILAQCEHDYKARGILITTDEDLGKRVIKEVEEQLKDLSTREIAEVSWMDNGEVIVVKSLNSAYEMANDYAPEHLEIHVTNEREAVEKLINYGSLFIGQNAAEVFGDYISGTNHTLPTVRAARYTGGVSVATFTKTVTHQKMTEEGIKNIGEIAERMAIGEDLIAHAKAARKRL
ncbi:histidinol dehydrogenase [Anaerosphaera aminiphila DSM 21120]|uniref:Histidinol dehydrogenase n=1 Tax=Anaerosphaera aminiphila DSM 21120 TaxID=1120995 RepID=A0A1M5QR51_9FIRM|nr:histidinol dehydrogenase [Anaerosphaera aminiphila]SHH16594.1 histidinol dehydrogenase [Anaerosphaera aminiphila DSM 21120]